MKKNIYINTRNRVQYILVVGENSISRNYIVMIRIESISSAAAAFGSFVRFIIIFAETRAT